MSLKQNEWEIIEDRFCPDLNYHHETIFTVANGYIGMRGTFEEGLSNYKGRGFEGNFLNGVYEISDIPYGEIGYAYPEKNQTMVNVANCKIIKLFIEGEAFDMEKGKLLEYRRSLSMKEGVLKRDVVWQSAAGHQIRLQIERLASLGRQNVALIRYRLTPLNFDGRIRLTSGIDGRIEHVIDENDPRVGAAFAENMLVTTAAAAGRVNTCLIQHAQNSGYNIVSMVDSVLDCDCPVKRRWYSGQDSAGMEYEILGEKGKQVELVKYIVYYTGKESEDILQSEAERILRDAKAEGFDALMQEQRGFLDAFWDKSDVVIKGDEALQQAIRFNMFHLLQSTGRDGKTNISAKGLTGEGYEGHYFWDTEMYVIPFFLFSNPEISRKLLEYRYNTLDQARLRARQMSHKKGALFPWRTINGEECSAYFPASTAQYHINADIAFAIKQYMQVTEDEKFLMDYGAEVLFETARLWMELGFFNKEKEGRFCINCVTGPDEYTAIVNNNCYTNLMAKENLLYAYDVAQKMKAEYPDRFAHLTEKIGLLNNEWASWKDAGECMYIPFNAERGIYPQDDSFLDKEVWDFDGTPAENYPLLLHYHPLVIYRHQVCKQADLVLALSLLGEKFSLDEKRKNFDYYEKITTHDSSLSACIFSIVASDIGYHEKACGYFSDTAKMDIEDYHGNTRHGIHTANMAGSWRSIVNGFAGMHIHSGNVSFSPYLPIGWESYCVKVFFKGCRVQLTVDKAQVCYELIEGDELEVLHKGKLYVLKKGIKETVNN